MLNHKLDRSPTCCLKLVLLKQNLELKLIETQNGIRIKNKIEKSKTTLYRLALGRFLILAQAD